MQATTSLTTTTTLGTAPVSSTLGKPERNSKVSRVSQAEFERLNKEFEARNEAFLEKQIQSTVAPEFLALREELLKMEARRAAEKK